MYRASILLGVCVNLWLLSVMDFKNEKDGEGARGARTTARICEEITAKLEIFLLASGGSGTRMPPSLSLSASLLSNNEEFPVT